MLVRYVLLTFPIHRRSFAEYYRDHDDEVQARRRELEREWGGQPFDELPAHIRLAWKDRWHWPPWYFNDRVGYLKLGSDGESSLLGDPYFLDVSKPDPEGDCPVYTAMSGQERWAPTLAASSFAQFLRILSTAMEVAAGFGDAIMDDEDEDAFREALGPKVKIIDAAALRAGHWT